MNNTDSTNAMAAMSAAADDLISESAPLPLPLDLLPVEALPLPALPDALRPRVMGLNAFGPAPAVAVVMLETARDRHVGRMMRRRPLQARIGFQHRQPVLHPDLVDLCQHLPLKIRHRSRRVRTAAPA